MDWKDFIGFAAALLTTASFLPQVLHTYRSRDTQGISLWMYSLFTLGVGCWLVYGILVKAWPIIVANAVTFALAASILRMKIAAGLAARPARESEPGD